ncbi:MAG: hypothetical protein ACI8RD_011833 [Bacillariaceae sp.]|jgi:hypothetical protein
MREGGRESGNRDGNQFILIELDLLSLIEILV